MLLVSSLLGACAAQPSKPTSNTAGEAVDKESECSATYTNPIIWEDLPDPEVIRVNDTYYYTASTFHHSPGAPLLRSYDLVHWEYLSHSVPSLDFDKAYDLEGGSAYVKGIWASTLQYRESNETFYWMGCMHDLGGAYVFTAKQPEGPWQGSKSDQCYYDMGLLIDDDDRMYVAFGNNTISVAELTADGLSEKSRKLVLQTPDWVKGPLEGARFNKIDGNYYIFLTQYANGEYVARSTHGPFGPYELRPFAVALPYGGRGAGGQPHQGGLVKTQHGDWYYMAFNDAFPAGRLPVMAPVTWSEGWPSVELVNGQWGASYAFPNLACGKHKVNTKNTRDEFTASTLNPEWEWNHNPDNSKWASGKGLVMQTASLTKDLYAAKNTLTRRIAGPRSSATVALDISAMKNGDVAGLAVFRDLSAWIGIRKSATTTQLVMSRGQALGPDWKTASYGSDVASKPVNSDTLWLRVDADVTTTEEGGTAKFYWSLDGMRFEALGDTFVMKREWNYFLGYRFAIFNYATATLGGAITVKSFNVEQ
ncbi:beta-xylosidase [Alteromonadaceae bacterium 2753L.S.0a.02]|nr:beta-xylosidase [Alteromonadaceae bacterium 2753L.S.0a.02]